VTRRGGDTEILSDEKPLEMRNQDFGMNIGKSECLNSLVSCVDFSGEQKNW
jgi:hypothetical protein